MFNLKISVLVLVCLCLFLGASCVCAHDTDNNVTVQDNIDVGDGGLSVDSNASFSQLQDIIDNSEVQYVEELNDSAYVINLDKDYMLMSGESPISFQNSDYTYLINGNGHYLDGNGLNRIMKIDTQKVILNDVVFKNGKIIKSDADNSGGAICSGGIVIVNNCIFKNNSIVDDGYKEPGNVYPWPDYTVDVEYGGGAIYSKGSLTLNNSEFEDNSIVSGSQYAGGEAIFVDSKSPDFIINNCVFNSNGVTSSNVDGGVIYSRSKTYVNNSVFTDNYGGLHIGSADVDVANSEFTANKGIALTDDEGTLTIENCHFNSNDNNNVIHHLSSPIDGSNRGGAIHADKLKICGDNYFISNVAQFGGAIYTSTIIGDVKHAIFRGNKAMIDGGAIYINNEYDGQIAFCQFENNHAEGRGGAIFVDSHFSDIKITNNNILHNTAAFGNTGYTYNNGGTICGDAFILGPNYYGEEKKDREHQFYYDDLPVDLFNEYICNPLGFGQTKCHEQKVSSYCKESIDIYTNNYVKAEDSGVTFDDVKDTMTEIEEWYRVIPIPEPIPIIQTIDAAMTVIDSIGDIFDWW